MCGFLCDFFRLRNLWCAAHPKKNGGICPRFLTSSGVRLSALAQNSEQVDEEVDKVEVQRQRAENGGFFRRLP